MFLLCLYLEWLYINTGKAQISEQVSQTPFTIDLNLVNEKSNSVAWILTLKKIKSVSRDS